MRTWLVIVAAAALGCGDKVVPQQTPAERYNAESEALERLKADYAPFARLANDAEIHKDPEAVIEYGKYKDGIKGMERAIDLQQKRVNEARKALEK